MNKAQELHDLGQSIWLDNITREILDNGTLRRYINEFSVTGLTSNPTIFDEAIGNTAAYDQGIRDKAKAGKSGEALFTEQALEDLRRAADLFHPVFDATDGVDGWVSMEVSPLLANDTAGSIAAAARIHAQAERPNLYVKIPGTPEGGPAIEQSIFNGIPINVTLLFSREQYVAAAEAYLRGIERRIAAKRDPRVASVASLFVSRWDKAVSDKAPPELRNRLGIAIAVVPTARIASCSPRRAGASSPRAAHGRSACCGPAPEPRIPRRRTPCTSRHWRRPTPSTPCPKRHCAPSPSMARSRASWPRMAETRKASWRVSPRPASIPTRSPGSCSATARRRS